MIPELINQRIKLKTEDGQQRTASVRPISAQLISKLDKLELQNIDNCELLSKAYGFDRKVTESIDRKPSSFLVKQRKRLVKHIQGYHTVVLKREDIDGDKYSTEQKNTLKEKVSPYLTTYELPKPKKKSG